MSSVVSGASAGAAEGFARGRGLSPAMLQSGEQPSPRTATMPDPRLARAMVEYSTNIHRGDRVLLEAEPVAAPSIGT